MVQALTSVACACRTSLHGHEELLLLIQECLLPLVILGPTFARGGGRRLMRIWVDSATHAQVPLIEYTMPALYEAIRQFGVSFANRAVEAISLSSPVWKQVAEQAARDDARDVLALVCDRLPQENESSLLEIAIERRKLDLIRWLHERQYGAPPTCRALGLAAKSGSIEILEWFVESEYFEVVRGLPEWQQEFAYRNALQAAIQGGHFGVVQWLYEHHSMEEWSGVAIGEALVHNHMEITVYLMQVSTVTTRQIQDLDLCALARRGDVSKLEWLHNHGLLAGILNSACLDEAKTHGHVHVLEFLESNVPTEFNQLLTPFNGSNAAGGSIQAAQWALARDRLEKSLSCVYGAAMHGHIDFVRWYVATMENETMTFFPNYEAVRIAASNGQLECVQFLVEKGWGEVSRQAIMAAAECGHLDTLNWLMRHCNKQFSMEVLCVLAAARGHLDIVKWLYMKYGNPIGGVIRRAAYGGHEHVIQWLLENATPANDEMEAAMYEAVRRGQLRIVRILPWSSNCDAESLARLARFNGHNHVAKWIERFRSTA